MASLYGSSYLVGISRGWQWELLAMDFKDNCWHDAQPPAVDIKLRKGKGVSLLKRHTEGVELLPPHCVTLLRETKGSSPDKAGFQIMVLLEVSTFSNTGTDPGMEQRGLPPCLPRRTSQSEQVSQEKGRGIDWWQRWAE